MVLRHRLIPHRSQHTWRQAGLLTLLVAGLSACVTINIYFPAAAAEKAADKVIDEVWQTPASPDTQAVPAPATQSEGRP